MADLQARMRSLLQDIQIDRNRWKERPMTGIAAADLPGFHRRAEEFFGFPVPTEIDAFLLACDGLDNNGYVIYGSGAPSSKGIESLIDANTLWRDSPDKADYVFFAETGDSLFALHIGHGYRIFDRYSMDEYGHYDSLQALIVDVLDRMTW